MNASRGLLLAAALAAAFTQCSVDQDGYRFDDASDGGTSGDGAGGASGDSAGGTPTTGGQDGAGGDTGAAGAGGTAGGDASGGTGNGAGSAGEGQGGTPTTGGSAGAANGGSAGAGAETSGGEAGAGGIGGVGGAGGDGSGGVSGSTGFCAGRTRPAGVAASDYDCFSFEPGLPSNTVWKPPTSLGMATSMLSTARAVSLPNSWFVTVPSAASAMPSQSTLARSFVGATEITTVVISADISLVSPVGVTPSWTGSVDLLCLDTGSGETCVSYTEGGNTEFQSPYSGIYVSETYVGGPAFIRDCKVTGTIATGTWTRVELRSVMKGQTTVLLNGANGAAACSLTYLVDSAAEVRVGLASHPTTGRALSAYYDNVEAYVIR